ncbi:bacteriocin immunity protein [Pseudomonas sp. GL-B-19]|uniref:bacteriocin immunity protein n=1 Tax=Pseudomonas sp. GL-B-19 TaxID=2832393 RepID=UPI001CBFCDF0|nr:bacteriocin immunity protein [Pseudomonas sp. GL-B-19]
MRKLNISDYTETAFLEFLNKICRSEYTTEKKLIRAVLLFDELTEHPDGADLIYYAESDEDSTPEAIIEKVKAWRAANGKPGFKIEE